MKTAVLKKADRVLVAHLEITGRLSERIRGLLGRDGLPPGHALYIAPCDCIHTIGMRFDLDLVFVGRELEVLRIVRGVSPWRTVCGGRGARGVIELQAGRLPESALSVGDRLEIEIASDG